MHNSDPMCDVEHRPCAVFTTVAEALSFADDKLQSTGRSHKVLHPRATIFAVVDEEAHDNWRSQHEGSVLRAAATVPPGQNRKVVKSRKSETPPKYGRVQRTPGRRQSNPMSARSFDF